MSTRKRRSPGCSSRRVTDSSKPRTGARSIFIATACWAIASSISNPASRCAMPKRWVKTARKPARLRWSAASANRDKNRGCGNKWRREEEEVPRACSDHVTEEVFGNFAVAVAAEAKGLIGLLYRDYRDDRLRHVLAAVAD